MTNKFILGKKVGMTEVYNSDGNIVPVTVIESGVCPIVAVKSKERDGYDAVKIAFEKWDKLNAPERGVYSRKYLPNHRYLKEFRVNADSKYKDGDNLTIGQFAINEVVSVTGTSIGKGFAGTIKRHNFHRGPMSHGSKTHRLPGSSGAKTWPAEVRKGHRGHGQMGNERVTVKNLKVIRIDEKENLIFLKGAVPGAKNGLVYIHN